MRKISSPSLYKYPMFPRTLDRSNNTDTKGHEQQHQHNMAPTNEDKDIEIGNDDTEVADGHSTIDSDTTSLTSSVFHYVYENGRRYSSKRSSSGEYVLPNDEKEQERLDLFHHLFSLMLHGELFLAPIREEWRGKHKRVLDLGTGTGIWAIDLADAYPEWEVLGTGSSSPFNEIVNATP